MITYIHTGNRFTAQEMCEQLAGDWFIVDTSPYTLAEQHELIAELPQASEEEMLQILSDNILNGKGGCGIE